MAVKPGLTWNVKDSFVAYVEALDDGVAEALDPASRSETGFFFPSAPTPQEAADPDGSGSVLQFLGAARLTGHWGMLDVELRNPRIELDGPRGTLSIRERGGRDPEKTLPLADLELVRRSDAGDGSVRLELSASLTGQGSLLLGGQYAPGQALSPIHVCLAQRHA